MRFVKHEMVWLLSNQAHLIKQYNKLKVGESITQFSLYHKFLIKSPRHLFQTWLGGPGIYLKPGFDQGPAIINEVFSC